MIRLLVTVPCSAHVQARFQKECDGLYEIVFANEDPEIIAKELPRAEVVIGEPSPKLFTNIPCLRWMQITWAGADRYTRRFPENVILTNASGAFGRIISEYTLGMILSMYKRLPQYYVNQKKQLWEDLGAERSLWQQKAVILGTGNVGQNIAQKLQAFGAHTIGCSRSGKPAPYFDEVYPISQLEELLPQADLVIGCLPRTKETEHLLDKRRLSLIPKDALLVNVGRGATIVTKDLEDLVCSGHFYGVILDVTDPEPLPQESPLWPCQRVLLTPHVSGIGFGHEPATEAVIWDICFENLSRYAKGEPLINQVDICAGY